MNDGADMVGERGAQDAPGLADAHVADVPELVGELDPGRPNFAGVHDRNTKSIYWAFTINNPDCGIVELAGAEEALLSLLVPGDCSYLVYGRETGREGTPHLQGFGVFLKPLRRRQVCRLLGGGARCGILYDDSTPSAAARYCKKEGDFVELGHLDEDQRPGRRTDLESIRIEIDGGATRLEIFQQHFSQAVYHDRAFEVYRSLVAPPPGPRFNLRVMFLWGDSNQGKTSYAHSRSPGLYTVPAECETLTFFTFYRGQEAVLIDDYCGGAPVSLWLKILDPRPNLVKVSHGYVQWEPTKIYITSNLPPSELFTGRNAAQTQALRNRLHRVVRVTGVDYAAMTDEERAAHLDAIDQLPEDWQ